jgi:hypothetical protein
MHKIALAPVAKEGGNFGIVGLRESGWHTYTLFVVDGGDLCYLPAHRTNKKGLPKRKVFLQQKWKDFPISYRFRTGRAKIKT